MELARLDGQVDRNTKKESPAPSTESTQSTQGAERASLLFSETNRCAERSTDSIPKSEYLYDEVKQAKDTCSETSRLDRARENEPIGSMQITDVDTKDKIQLSEFSKEDASSTGDYNNRRSPDRMGCHTVYNFFYPDTAGYYQKVRSMDSENVARFQQETGTCGYPQGFGGFSPNNTSQQMNVCSNLNRQHDSVLQYQPPS
jgi:hypothetical protein